MQFVFVLKLLLQLSLLFVNVVMHLNPFNFAQNFFMRIMLVAVLFLSLCTRAQIVTKEINNGMQRPKLVVGIVVDQMRWDYLYRYYNRFGEGGFKRLINAGFSFENTMIPYTPAVTAAGHTCIYTGSVPAIHGITGNDWRERNSGGAYMYCAQDTGVRSVGTYSVQGQMSPKNLLATTIGDELRLATNFKSRVFGVALKDRGAILPAGHSANAAYWFDDSTGNFITSSFYMKELPQWVQEFNAKKQPDSLLKNGWNLLNPVNFYDQSTADNNKFERPAPGDLKTVFPHTYSMANGKNYNSFRTSPFGNSFTFSFAAALLQSEKPGLSGQTDMLCISLSSTDYIGHSFGPQSQEVEDTYLRLDKDLAAFLQLLDKREGVGNYLLFLSADHGAPQSSAFLNDSAIKIPAGSIGGFTLRNEVNVLLQNKFKVKDLVQAYTEYQFYFNKAKIDSAGIDENLLYEEVLAFLKKKPEVITAFSYRNFDKAILPEVLRQKLTNGYYYKRSGDIQIIVNPQYTDGFKTGTDHGVWYNYDTHIPLLWYGWKVKPGKTNRETYMTDIAPTIAAMLHIQMPNGSVGKVLTEIVQ